jgi:protein-S-isoprenylcysteine O-methyltransferase Ste14
MALLAVPVSQAQLWVFTALALGFFAVMIVATRQSGGGGGGESGATRNNLSRVGILLQAVGIGTAGFGPVRASLPPLSPAALAETAAVVLLAGGAIALFAASARALGANWSIVARTRSDHQLVRGGPYGRIRHPIYLGLLLFLLALTVALGHFAQLLVAIPVFVAGTAIRTRIEDRLLETKFGDDFRDYARTTPAIIPRIGA